jgi:hypothetical protein
VFQDMDRIHVIQDRHCGLGYGIVMWLRMETVDLWFRIGTVVL